MTIARIVVSFSSPIKDPPAAGARRLLDEIRDQVAQGVDLNDELQALPFRFAHPDQAVDTPTKQEPSAGSAMFSSPRSRSPRGDRRSAGSHRLRSWNSP
jgi:hypothetical protein